MMPVCVCWLSLKGQTRAKCFREIVCFRGEVMFSFRHPDGQTLVAAVDGPTAAGVAPAEDETPHQGALEAVDTAELSLTTL